MHRASLTTTTRYVSHRVWKADLAQACASYPHYSSKGTARTPTVDGCAQAHRTPPPGDSAYEMAEEQQQQQTETTTVVVTERREGESDSLFAFFPGCDHRRRDAGHRFASRGGGSLWRLVRRHGHQPLGDTPRQAHLGRDAAGLAQVASLTTAQPPRATAHPALSFLTFSFYLPCFFETQKKRRRRRDPFRAMSLL
ncbi:hypothetical protein TW95_gp1750 [Pandoravirus inopinatum]|uniref:Uncharacterized protein n=1 Tax=Pandoravirus inopinatum TaxID=1605721 RepID=A0A0B5J4C2_9VIRU|nr:hypothetical protein TW95_gp1750 [Pandoravirus inopinatum]AJF98484.1 hypothetical protein [Pandoravirus inopinatum]